MCQGHLNLMDDHGLVCKVHNRFGHCQCERSKPSAITPNQNKSLQSHIGRYPYKLTTKDQFLSKVFVAPCLVVSALLLPSHFNNFPRPEGRGLVGGVSPKINLALTLSRGDKAAESPDILQTGNSKVDHQDDQSKLA